MDRQARSLPSHNGIGIEHSNGSGTDDRLRNPIFVGNKSHPIHRWVNWIAGFSWQFAGDAIDRYLPAGSDRRDALVLDPFAGVGTTLIEAQRRGVATVGFEINPVAHLAAKAKLEAGRIAPEMLRAQIADFVAALTPMEVAVDADGPGAVPGPRRTAPPGFRSRIPFFSPKVEVKVLLTLDYLDALPPGPVADLFRLAFAATMVGFSNYTYEPSLGSRPGAGKPVQENAPVVPAVADKLRQMADDLAADSAERGRPDRPAPFQVYRESFFTGARRLADNRVDLVVTSPPYLNNYHYVRNTRPHLFWLGYVSRSKDLRQYEQQSFGKFWQTVRQGPPVPLAFDLPSLAAQIEALRQLNPQKGIYGGAGWANYAVTYFNDSYRFLRELGRLLRPGGTAVIVVGNNILQGIEFKVDEGLVQIAILVGLDAHREIIRAGRVGASIIGTGLREKVEHRIELYEAAVVVQK